MRRQRIVGASLILAGACLVGLLLWVTLPVGGPSMQMLPAFAAGAALLVAGVLTLRTRQG